MWKSENCSWKQHDNTQSDVYSICHDKMEINSLSRGWFPLCINIPCIHCCSFPLFPKQTSGNGPTSEVSVCWYLFLMAALISFTTVRHTRHFWDIKHLQMSLKTLQYRHWSGLCSLSLKLTFSWWLMCFHSQQYDVITAPDPTWNIDLLVDFEWKGLKAIKQVERQDGPWFFLC